MFGYIFLYIISGLFNDNLEHQKPLSAETVKLINSFLGHLTKPICLLAHNGNGFDFLLLNSELKRINQSLDSSLLCADSLEAFRSLDGLLPRYQPLANQNERTPPNMIVNSAPPPVLKRKPVRDSELSPDLRQEKKPKLDTEHDKVDKVKKRLMFEDDEKESSGAIEKPNGNAHNMSETIETEKSNVSLKMDTCELNKVESTSDNAGSFDHQFSGSLEDSVYLEALEEAELKYVEQNKTVEQEPAERLNDPNLDSDLSNNVLFSNNSRSPAACSESESSCSSSNLVSSSKTLSGSKVDSAISSTVSSSSLITSRNIDTSKPDSVSMLDQSVSTTDNSAHTPSSTITVSKSSVSTTDNSAHTPSSTMTVSKSSVSTTDNSAHTPSSTMTVSKSSVSAISQLEESSVSLVQVSPTKASSTTGSLILSTATEMSQLAAPSVSNVQISPTKASPSSSSTSAASSQLARAFTPLRKTSYKLEEIYLRLYGRKPQQSHLAEDDCVTLVFVARKTPGFMEWVDENAVLLSTVEAPK